MTTYFTDAGFKFLRGLARHNQRAWFNEHKADYDKQLREQFQRMLHDLQTALAGVSTNFRVDPKPVGCSLYRIHLDTRFASTSNH